MIDIDPPVVLASLSGTSDATWAAANAAHVGGAMLGGVALDEPTRGAARGAVARDREEFLPTDPIAFIDDQLRQLSTVDVQAGVNVRASTPAAIEPVAEVCRARGAILEINAHCRQPECTAIGCGQALMRDPQARCAQVRAGAVTGAAVSVKLRTEVPGVDLVGLCDDLEQAGAAILHIDAMDSRSRIRDIARQVDTPIIANNNVRTAADVREYVGYGADAVSVGRASTRPAVLQTVREAVPTDGIRFYPGAKRPTHADQT